MTGSRFPDTPAPSGHQSRRRWPLYRSWPAASGPILWGCPQLPMAISTSTTTTTAGRAAEVAVESRHVLGIARVTGTVRANTRRERQSSHCMNQLHSWHEPDEKLEGSFFLTSTRQKSILRGSEIFGYDEKEYPERMLQRAAGWCKAVQGVRGKILSELSG